MFGGTPFLDPAIGGLGVASRRTTSTGFPLRNAGPERARLALESVHNVSRLNHPSNGRPIFMARLCSWCWNDFARLCPGDEVHPNTAQLEHRLIVECLHLRSCNSTIPMILVEFGLPDVSLAFSARAYESSHSCWPGFTCSLAGLN